MEQKSQRELSRARCATVHCEVSVPPTVQSRPARLDFAQRTAVPSASLTPEGAHVPEWR
jgi:hypothetical protein